MDGKEPADSNKISASMGPKKLAHEWSNWRRANYAFFDSMLRDAPRTSTLFDLGAGALHFEHLFRQFDYIGVDFMPFPHVSIVTDLTQTLPIPDESADIVVLSNTVEHIPNSQHLFSECYRIMRPGGLIVGTIPFLVPVHQAPYDFNRYTHIQLQTLLADAGFRDVAVLSLGDQLDAYNTIELKTFDELYKTPRRSFLGRIVLRGMRKWRRLEMRALRRIFGNTAASLKVTEGYGFSARR